MAWKIYFLKLSKKTKKREDLVETAITLTSMTVVLRHTVKHFEIDWGFRSRGRIEKPNKLVSIALLCGTRYRLFELI